jgi:hypothetical protein
MNVTVTSGRRSEGLSSRRGIIRAQAYPNDGDYAA